MNNTKRNEYETNNWQTKRILKFFFGWVSISPVPSMLRLICEPTSSVLLRLLVAGEDPILNKRKKDIVMLEEK